MYNRNCSRIPDCAETSNLNSHNSQLIIDNTVTLAALERYESLLVPRKIWWTLHEQNLIYTRIIADCSWKTAKDRNRIWPQTAIYLCSYLRFLTRELMDMPTKSQHSLQKSKSRINIITNQTKHQKFILQALTQLAVLTFSSY